MLSYGLPDPTGTNAFFLQANIPFFIYKNGMKISFENSPIYSDSLIITLTDGTSRQLEKDVDWEVRSDDIDETAMSRAYLENVNFNKTLVKSVTIISTLALNQPVAMTFQQYYLTVPGRTFDNGTPLELTPDLIKDLVRGQADIRQQIARVTSPVAPNLTVPKLLPFDINSQKAGNIIVDELVTVNTVAGAKVVRLAQGAFFKDSLVLKYNGNTLSADSDYMAINLSPLTSRSTNVSGIYQHILLLGSFAGDLQVTYHAVGGEVQRDDVSSVYELMTAIKSYLNDGIFVTSDSLPDTTAFRAMFARLTVLEDDMRRLLTGNPTYGDSATGLAVTRPISASDADIHWYTIASLYQVEGSTDIIRADQFKGRVYLPGSKIAVAFTVDFNLDQTRNIVDFTTQSVVFDPNYTLFNDVSVNAPQYPLVRTVYNQAAESFSGAYIQIGVPLPNLVDQMVVEDFSSAESCWILDRSNEFVVGGTVSPSAPADTGFLLPDGVSLWSDSSSVSYQKVFAPDYEEGYLVYQGAQVAITNLVTVENTGTLFNVVLPSYFPIHRIKELVVTMTNDDSTVTYDLVIPMTGLTDVTRMGRVNFIDSEYESMAMLAELTKDDLDAIAISLNVSEIALPLVSGTPSSKSDMVRYIRAKV